MQVKATNVFQVLESLPDGGIGGVSMIADVMDVVLEGVVHLGAGPIIPVSGLAAVVDDFEGGGELGTTYCLRGHQTHNVAVCAVVCGTPESRFVDGCIWVKHSRGTGGRCGLSG